MRPRSRSTRRARLQARRVPLVRALLLHRRARRHRPDVPVLARLVHRPLLRAIADSEPSDDLQVRMENLNAYFQYFLYRNVCRSLFEKDKLAFSLLLCTDLMRGYDKLDHTEWRYLLTGGMLLDASGLAKNPAPEWVTQKVWEDISSLSDIEALQGLQRALRQGAARRTRPS